MFYLSCSISSITLHTSDIQERLTFLLLLEESLLTTQTMKCLHVYASHRFTGCSLSSLYTVQFARYPHEHGCTNDEYAGLSLSSMNFTSLEWGDNRSPYCLNTLASNPGCTVAHFCSHTQPPLENTYKGHI